MELILVRSMTYFTLPKRDAVLYYLPVTVQGAFSPPHIRIFLLNGKTRPTSKNVFNSGLAMRKTRFHGS
jgi:hypothetical protein